MKISKVYQEDLASIRSALNIFAIKQMMHQDGATLGKLLEGLEEASSTVERYREEHLGNYIDILV